jgi:hypothetical protein
VGERGGGNLSCRRSHVDFNNRGVGAETLRAQL